MGHPIEIQEMSKYFRSIGATSMTRAVDRLSLSVPARTFMGLFGPNGAGKTTAIRTMMNIYTPSRGQARILGVSSTKLGPPQFRRIGFVAEDQELPAWMTVSELIRYCRPMYPTWDRQLCERLLDLFELPEDRKIKNLSRGMKMKAGLLSSLVYRPELVVLDEPFAGLAPLSRDQLIEGLMELSAEQSFTLLISSHDVTEVETLCDAMAFIENGRVTLTETTDQLLRRFRRVEVFRGDKNGPNNIPPRWKKIQREGPRMTFIETAFENEEEEKNRIRRVMPGASLKNISTMMLREIVVFLSDGTGRGE
jgi:ABC-2 type transport system ATP-binding protein